MSWRRVFIGIEDSQSFATVTSESSASWRPWVRICGNERIFEMQGIIDGFRPTLTRYHKLNLVGKYGDFRFGIERWTDGCLCGWSN
jgi:hypothetical protein